VVENAHAEVRTRDGCEDGAGRKEQAARDTTACSGRLEAIESTEKYIELGEKGDCRRLWRWSVPG
jgi:hypothetical protein